MERRKQTNKREEVVLSTPQNGVAVNPVVSVDRLDRSKAPDASVECGIQVRDPMLSVQGNTEDIDLDIGDGNRHELNQLIPGWNKLS